MQIIEVFVAPNELFIKYSGDEQLGNVSLSLVASFKNVNPPAPVSCQKCGFSAQD